MRTEDGHIIRKCLNGEPEAFGFLVDKYKGAIYAFAYARLRNFHDAEDVTQEVFIKAYQRLRTLRRWDNFHAWIYAITSNLCKDWIRARASRPDGEFTADQDPEILTRHSESSYREELMNEPLYGLLREALDSLPASYRQVLTFHYLGGMSSYEIAEFLGTSSSNVRMRLSRARSRLKEDMVAMMSTTLEAQRLPATFTFRIVEAIKHIRINPMPRMGGLPWGLSLAAGIIIAVLSLNPQMSMTSDMAIPTGSPFPLEAKVLKTGEIPVDILKTSEISFISSKQGDEDGGEPQSQAPQNAFMLAPPADGDIWTEKSGMPTARGGLSTCVVNGKIYAIGGVIDPNNATSAVEEYDPSTDTWTKKKNMPTIRGHMGTCAVNGRIYVMGGNSPNGSFSNVEEYDPETDTWTKRANMPIKMNHFTACAVNGKIYAFGGWKGNNAVESVVYEYDPAADTWTRKADMLTGRASCSSVVVNDKIHVIGGTLPPAWEHPGIATVEEYDPATDTWTEKADMPTPRYAFAASALNGKIYVFGGDDAPGNGKLVSNTEEYDPATDTWIQRSDPPTERKSHSSSVVDGRIYIIGGYEGGSGVILSLVEDYIPGSVSVESRGKLPTTWGEVKSE